MRVGVTGDLLCLNTSSRWGYELSWRMTEAQELHTRTLLNALVLQLPSWFPDVAQRTGSAAFLLVPWCPKLGFMLVMISC